MGVSGKWWLVGGVEGTWDKRGRMPGRMHACIMHYMQT